MSEASWWNGQAAHPANDVRVHTPDPSQYHYVDGRQSELMKAGRLTGVVIPRARPGDDGRSRAFDGGHAGVMHVDPDAPDGGVIVDATRLTDAQLLHHGAGETGGNPDVSWEVYYKVGAKPTAPPPMPHSPTTEAMAMRGNPVMPGGYVVPKAAQDGSQLGPQSGDQQLPFAVPGVVYPQEVPHVEQQPQPQYVMPPPGQLVPPAAVSQPSDPAQPAPAPEPIPVSTQVPTAQVMPAPAPVPVAVPMPAPAAPVEPTLAAAPAFDPAAMQQMVASMVKSAVQQIVPPPPPLPPVTPVASAVAPQPSQPLVQPPQYSQPAYSQPPAAIPAPPAPAPAASAESFWDAKAPVSAETPRQGRLAPGFESLDMSFINGPIAVKAKNSVVFDMGPEFGTLSSKYHAVVEGEGCIALIYDTRYEDGTQWAPPNRGTTPLSVSCPELKKSWDVSSMGIQFSIGVLDIIVLIRNDESNESSPPPMMQEP